jgi:N-methylhydantoinase A
MERGLKEVEAEGIPSQRIAISADLDQRYQGQSYELTIPFGREFLQDFHEAHELDYGYADPNHPVEIVNLRVRAIGRIDQPSLPSESGSHDDVHAAKIGERPVVLGGTDHDLAPVPFFDGLRLQPGHSLVGPIVIAYPDTTVLLDGGDRAEVDTHGNLLIEVAPL